MVNDNVGSWFIRVPNKEETEEPMFAPPDAVKTSYDDMIVNDISESISAHSTRFNGPLC